MHSGKKPVDNGIDNVPDNGGDDVYDYDDYDIASLGKYIQNGNHRHPLSSMKFWRDLNIYLAFKCIDKKWSNG